MKPSVSDPKSYALTVAQGFCMGAADVVPGVSGGTMAFILGIYQRLINAVRAFDLVLVRELLRGRVAAGARHVDLVFLLPLGFGIFCALMFFTRVVSLPGLIQSDPELIYGLFFGLIGASIVVLVKAVEGIGGRDGLWLAIGTLVGFGVVNLVPMETPETSWFVFLSGALAISAMILPGISGSFILLILKKYAYIFDAIGRLEIGVLIPFGLGVVTGVLAFSRVLSWLLATWYRQTLVFITGLLLGSLWLIWPFQQRTYEVIRGKSRLIQSVPTWPETLDVTVGLSALLTVVGVAAVLWLHALAARRSLQHPSG